MSSQYKTKVIESFDQQEIMKTFNSSIHFIRPGEIELKFPYQSNYSVPGSDLNALFDKLIKGPGKYVVNEYVYGKPLTHIIHPPILGTSRSRRISSPLGYISTPNVEVT